MWPSEQNLALQCFPITQRAIQKWLCWKNYSQGHNCNEVLSRTYNIIKISNSTHVNSHPTWLEADLVFGLGKCRQLFTLADHRGEGRKWNAPVQGAMAPLPVSWTLRERQAGRGAVSPVIRSVQRRSRRLVLPCSPIPSKSAPSQ